MLLRPSLMMLEVGLLAVIAVPAASALPSGFVPSVTYKVTDQDNRGVSPTAGGWYRQKVVVRWSVQPQASKTTGCEPAVLIPFQTAALTLKCTATWNSQGLTIIKETKPPIRIDWTRPTSVRVRAGRPPDVYGWYGRPIRFFPSGRDALSRIDVCPTRVYRGPYDPTALVTGFCRDHAGNVAKRTVSFKYKSPVLSPKRGRKFRRPPLLDWIHVKDARFYNIQMWHDGSKVLSRFRDASRFQISRTWLQNGVRRRLEPGRYNVYVWPRFAGRYGKRSLHTWFVKS
jgi:hypothetical protein